METLADRDVTWRYGAGYVELGEGSGTFVPDWATVTGKGLRGAPDLDARFEVRDGVPECVEFRLTAQPGGRAVRTADLRLFDVDGFTLNTFMRAVRRRRTDANDTAGPLRDDREWWASSADVADAQRQRRSANQAELEEVARIYRDNLSAAPTKAVEIGMDYSPRTAARRVQQARAAGLLPPTSPGKKKG